jgi:hypothetical protein
MTVRKDEYDQQNKNLQNQPSSIIQAESYTALPELDRMRQIFEQVEKESGEVAEELFEYLFDVDDILVITGKIPVPENKKIARYIESLNLLFKFSRAENFSSFRIINRRMVKELDKKTYLFCMCVDGGVSLDILCEVVNQENMARTPSKSPVRITVTQIASEAKGHDLNK